VLNDVGHADTVADGVEEIVESLGISCRIGTAFGSLPCDPEELVNQARKDALPPPSPPVPGWEDQYLRGASAN
jgi:hypothetical protein